MISWEDFVIRRKINIQSFLSYHNIDNKEKLIKHLSSIGVGLPSSEDINSMFPVSVSQSVKTQESIINTLQTNETKNDLKIVQDVSVDDNSKKEKIKEERKTEESSSSTRSNIRQRTRDN